MSTEKLVRAAEKAGWFRPAARWESTGFLRLEGVPPAELRAPGPQVQVFVEGRTSAKVLRRLMSPRAWRFRGLSPESKRALHVWEHQIGCYANGEWRPWMDALGVTTLGPAKRLPPCWPASPMVCFSQTAPVIRSLATMPLPLRANSSTAVCPPLVSAWDTRSWPWPAVPEPSR